MSFSDSLLEIPASKDLLPHVTPAMVQDELAHKDRIPELHFTHDRPFRWFCAIDDIGQIEKTDLTHLASQMLMMVRLDDAEALEQILPNASYIACIDDIDTVMCIQNLFVTMYMWENTLDYIVMKNGAIGELLDASTSILRNFIFVSDNNFNVIARTTEIDPPDDLHRSIIKNGCLTQATIAEERFRLPEETFYTREASDITPFDRVSFPIHIHHAYFGSISMSCNEKSDTPGLRDAFLILANHVQMACERLWAKETMRETPSFFFFERLLRGNAVTDEYVTAQLEENGLPENGLYKVVLFDVDPSIEPEKAYTLNKTASTLNNGHVRCFPFEHAVIAVLYGSRIDGELSHRKTIEEVTERIYGGLDIVSAVSSVFSGIENLAFAYRQAQIALGFRLSIDRERSIDGITDPRGIYMFEDALLYYLIDATERDEAFMEFTFNTSIVNILWEEDVNNGTDYLKILWFYLKNERNATNTAQELHMHRNTVLYHIDKIQQRFDFDMGLKSARDWMLACFKSLFSRLSGESLSTIFSVNR